MKNEQFIIKLDTSVTPPVPVGYPMLASNIYGDNHKYLKSSDIEKDGYAVYRHQTMPTNTDLTKEYVEVTPTTQNTDGEWLQEFVLQDKTFATVEEQTQAETQTKDSYKNTKLSEVKTKFEEASKRPTVPVTLSDGITVITVDGGRTDLDNFRIGKNQALTSVVDVDGISHTIDPLVDYDLIISEIEATGMLLYQTKWNYKTQIEAVDVTLLVADYKIAIDAIVISY